MEFDVSSIVHIGGMIFFFFKEQKIIVKCFNYNDPMLKIIVFYYNLNLNKHW